MEKSEKKPSVFNPSQQQNTFLGKVFIELTKEGSLNQKNGELLMQMLKDMGKNRTIMETPTPHPLALQWGMSYVTLRNGLSLLSKIGAITVHKESSVDSIMNIEIHYDFNGKNKD